MLKNINFSPGVITYNDYSCIDPKIPFENQWLSFKEDLFQVSYKNDLYIVDVGWFPDHEKNGKFQVRIVKEYDWECPVYLKKTNNFKRLYKLVTECSEIVRDLIKAEEKK